MVEYIREPKRYRTPLNLGPVHPCGVVYYRGPEAPCTLLFAGAPRAFQRGSPDDEEAEQRLGEEDQA